MVHTVLWNDWQKNYRETDMEVKWYMIMCAVVLGVMMAGAAIAEYGKSQCQLELGKAGRSAEDIAKICR
jgi:hypothetical protein